MHHLAPLQVRLGLPHDDRVLGPGRALAHAPKGEGDLNLGLGRRAAEVALQRLGERYARVREGVCRRE